VASQVTDGRLELDRIGPDAVTQFVLDMSGLYAVGSMKTLTSGLRSLLRFLFTAGDIDRDLSPAVPSVAGRQLSGIPADANDEAVSTLPGSCDRSAPAGRRDFAILLLMERLGAAGSGSRQTAPGGHRLAQCAARRPSRR
jgi:hypothetical protein